MRIIRRTVAGAVLPLLAPPVIRLLASTWKVEQLGLENYEEAMRAGGQMGTLWHGRMLVALKAHMNEDLRILVSPSADGALVTTLLKRFGYHVIVGSSNKSPAGAVRSMLSDLRQGGSIVITPDGPRGPRHSMNAGAAWMARETGFPVLPCGFVCDRAWHASSWDHFTIPKPRARVALVYGEPLYVDAKADGSEVKRAAEEVKRRMLAAERRGFEHLGQEPDWVEEPER